MIMPIQGNPLKGTEFVQLGPNGETRTVSFIAQFQDSAYGLMYIMGYPDVAGRTVLMMVSPSGLVNGDKTGWIDLNNPV